MEKKEDIKDFKGYQSFKLIPSYSDYGDVTNWQTMRRFIAHCNKYFEYLNDGIKEFLKLYESMLENMDEFDAFILAWEEMKKDNAQFKKEIHDMLENWIDDPRLKALIDERLLNNKLDKTVFETFKVELNSIIEQIKLENEQEHKRLDAEDVKLSLEIMKKLDKEDFEEFKRNQTTIKVNNKFNTNDIQKVINEFNHVVFKKGIYILDLWHNGHDWDIGLELKSNSTYIFESGAELQLGIHNKKGYDILRCYNVENVHIYGAMVNGRRDLNTSNEHGEWGAGIGIRGSRDIVIENSMFKNCWGDGIYVGHSNGGVKPSENVSLNNVICDNNRRQGISVISVDGLIGDNVTLSNTNGIDPEAGIDFESNFHEVREEVFKNIIFSNLKTINNKGSGVMGAFTGMSEKGSEEPISIKVTNYTSINDKKGVSFMNLVNTDKTGLIQFENVLIKNSVFAGMTFESVSKDSARIQLKNITVVNPFTNQITQEHETHAINFLRFALSKSKFPKYVIGNIDVDGLTVTQTGDKDYPLGDIKFNDGGLGCYHTTLKNVGHKITNHLTLVRSTIINPLVNWETASGVLPKNGELYGTYWITSGSNVTLPKATEYMDSLTYRFVIMNYKTGSEVKISPASGDFIVPYQHYKNGVIAKDKDYTGWFIDFKVINKKWTVVAISGEWVNI